MANKLVAVNNAASRILGRRGRYRLRFVFCLAGVLFVIIGATSALFAQDNPIAPTREQDVIKPQAECNAGGPVPVSISASAFELTDSKVFGRGKLSIIKGNQRLYASEAEYDLETEIGTARDVYFTTCTCQKPDYHITADSVKILPNNKLVARDVSVYLGRTRLLKMPKMLFRMGGRSSLANIFPRIGNNTQDGLTLRQSFRLIDTDHSRTTLNLKLTEKNSFQAGLDTKYGIAGKLIDMPGRYLTYGSMRSRTLEAPQPIAENCDPQLLRPKNAARLLPYGKFTIRQRTYDANDPGLVVYRQPEIGVSYVGTQLSLTKEKLDPRLELYPQITANWGIYKESPGQESSLARGQIVMQGGLNAVWLGPKTTIQPVGIISYADYAGGDTFRTYGFGIDAAHLSDNGAFYSARYISRTSSGETPFQFDDIDIRQELDVGIRTYLKKHVFGFALNYDMSGGYLFDWQVLYGQRTDCLEMYVRWDNRFKHLSFDIGLINL